MSNHEEKTETYFALFCYKRVSQTEQFIVSRNELGLWAGAWGGGIKATKSRDCSLVRASRLSLAK